MKDQYLFDNLQNAQNHKQNILNNRGAYTHSIAVTVTHKTRVFSFFKWVWDRWDETHYETRFDQARFDRDLSDADQRINSCNAAIDSKINNCKQELASLRSHNSSEEAKVNSLSSIINEYRQQQYNFAQSQSQLKSFIDRCHGNQVNYKDGRIASQENEIYRIANQIESVQSQIKNNQTQISNLNDRIALLRESLEEGHKAIFDSLTSLDNSRRSAIVADLFGQQGTEHVIDMIVGIGFNANELAYRAVEKNSIETFKLALSRGANCASYMVDGQTILQKLFVQSKENFITEVLSEDINLDNSILNAIKNGDLVSFNRLLEHDSAYTQKLIHGYSVLHISMCAQNPDLVHSIITKDQTSVGVHNSRGESSMKIALRSSTDQIISELVQYIDLNLELGRLIEERETLLFDKLINVVGINNIEMEHLLSQALKCSSIEIASHIIDQGIDLSELFRAALHDDDQVTINNIIEIDYHLYENLLSENNMVGATDLQSEYQIQPH